MGRFHLNDGLCFTRTESGGVRIEKFAAGVNCFAEGAKPEWSVETMDSGWASVVAHVSAEGESSTTWALARAFHNSGPRANTPETRLGPWTCEACGETRPRSGTIGASSIPCPKCGAAMRPFVVAFEGG